MKSIMQEASSIAKAIEQGWIKAGSPTDFSVKILEQPKKNFFGLTVHPAKIAIYFDEKPTQRRPQESERFDRPQQQRKPRPAVREISREPRETRAHDSRESRDYQRSSDSTHKQSTASYGPDRSLDTQKQNGPQMAERPDRSDFVKAAPERGQYQFEPQWTEDMNVYTRQWLEYVLKSIHAERINFTIEPNNLYLRITLSEQITDNPEKEKRMLASFSLLLLETLKRHFKVGLRRHKIVLTHAR